MELIKTIYGFLNGQDPKTGLFIGTAVTEEGETICSVLVRSEQQMCAALGMDGYSTNMHQKYRSKYTKSYALEFVPWNMTMSHSGLGRAIELFRKRTKNEERSVYLVCEGSLGNKAN